MRRERRYHSRSLSRNSRRQSRPTLREAFEGATTRARQRSNRRLGKRLGMTSVRAAIAGAGGDDIEHLNIIQRVTRWLLALLLLPLCFIATRALFNVSEGQATFWQTLLATKQFLYFGVGMFLMAGWFFSRIGQRFFLYFYVLGHELTHAVFVYACGGKIAGMRVTADGGYVMTNKSNVLIALSPYFVPFWSAIILGCSAVLELFVDLPYHGEALYLLIGASWTFHLLWTLWMIPRDQPDLQENGVFFSLTIIYLANVVFISVLLCLAPGNLTWHHWANELLDSWTYIKGYLHFW